MYKILYSAVFLFLTFQIEICWAQNTIDDTTTDSIEYINEETLDDPVFEDIGGEDIFFETDTIYKLSDVDIKPRLKSCKKVKPEKLESCFRENTLQHILKKFRYPEEARLQNIQEKIYIKIVFNKEGGVDDITCVRGVNKILIENSIKICEGIKLMEPAYHFGKPVSVEYIIPINYKIK